MTEPGATGALLRRALLLDLEVSHQGHLLKLGAALDTRILARPGRASFKDTCLALDNLAREAACVLGHNLIRHDLAILRQRAPGLTLHTLPVIDTLILSPICFPENPYHRLVKDYKLIRESVNDPVADARQAAVLFADEIQSLSGLRQTEPQLFELLHFLLATRDEPTRFPQTNGALSPQLPTINPPSGEGRGEEAPSKIDAQPSPPGAGSQAFSSVSTLNTHCLARGLDLVFEALGGARPSRDRALGLCAELFGRWACASVRPDAARLQTTAQRHALAYALTWLRVAGSNSVLPPWVRHEHPAACELIRRLREVPCDSPHCSYCRRVHNPQVQLRQFFGFDSFRPIPRSPTGGSLQQEIIQAGMRDESLLAILPTGGGKSLCYQLPALVRNYRRGALTIILSPLQALMKDQVDGLVRRTGTPLAAALYGLLTPPERSDVLRRIRLGDAAILYVSPEQLRNRSFAEAIAQRDIGCWVFDEAHCLSKWGHDFRPDYLYAGRFIREFAKKQGAPIPPIACFTATAKQDVLEEILAYFKTETGRELKAFVGGVERDNLRFEVQMIGEANKLEQIHHLLSDRLPAGGPGSAIVFRATREAAEVTADFLCAHGWKAAHFHAGLTPPEKKQSQDEFLAGHTQIICATNAFGMGIDKEDVRLVIHGDTPGSLENYLQEAGRAGRDGRRAECVLLYAEEDAEQQFRMEAFSELSRRDIAQILRGLRKATRGDKQELVITAGEILRDEELQLDIDLQDRMADTKVRTAISWLERAHLLQRDENSTTVFQARPLVQSLTEAADKLGRLNLSTAEQSLWLAIFRELFNTGPAESLTVDRLALLPEFANYARGNPAALANPEYLSAKILKILRSMTDVGLMKSDVCLNAFVRYKVADHSRLRLDRVLAADRKLVDVMALEAPDPEGWMPVSLRLLNQRLCDEGCASSPELVRALLQSLSGDGRGSAGNHGSIELCFVARDSYRLRVRRKSWTAINELAEKRRRLASLVLDTLLAKIPADAPPRADVLVEFHFEELHRAMERDPILRGELKDTHAALERALMFLHEQSVIVLQHGLAVFRSAMTIRFPPESRTEKYQAADYQPLEHHYKERILQVHVMSEYARLGFERIQAALELVLAYFTLPKDEFLRRYFKTKPDLLLHATTARSFQKIVTDLANPAQIKVVTAPPNRNMLLLAGPGSGKTRTVVHRCAYLLRVERVLPRSMLVCCFNRCAAIELRRRLVELVGDDARGVTVLTYHALAMRLLGLSFSAHLARPGQRIPAPTAEPNALRLPGERRSGPSTLNAQPSTSDIDFDALIINATKLLRGEQVPPGLEPDEVRDRLLAGFQYILVDEYQDIDEPQYDLISALAGRTLDDPDLRLSILAVGDDDQNIYAFRGANVEFLRRFQQDYEAEIHYLVENYRSTRYIIEAASQLIAANTDRMKGAHPICIDAHREMLPAGGPFGQLDLATKGKVQVIRVADDSSQAQAVIAEIQRLRALGVRDFSQMAVLSSTHRELAQTRALAEAAGIPIRWAAQRQKMAPLHQIREIRRFLRHLQSIRKDLRRAEHLKTLALKMFGNTTANPWVPFLLRLLDAWVSESANAELPVFEALEFLYEACAESRREFSYGEGVTLSTVHSAKGTEYDHVLLAGSWPAPPLRPKLEEARRAFYVGMTRARQSLAIFDRQDIRPSLPETLAGSAIVLRDFAPQSLCQAGDLLNYEVLGLEDIHLGYPARFREDSPVHVALARLTPGDTLTMRALEGNALDLLDHKGVCVARLSHKAEEHWRSRLDSIHQIRVLALVCRNADQDPEPARRENYQVQEWEIPLVEVVCPEPSTARSTH